MPQLSLHTPIGDLTVFEHEARIVALDWGWGDGQSRSLLLDEVIDRLDRYFDGQAVELADLPLQPSGTPYRQRVWAALRNIPAGQTRSYLDIARVAGGSARSVGQANGANPIPILIPCHRVVATSHLGGYSGAGGLATKRHLLALETRGPAGAASVSAA